MKDDNNLFLLNIYIFWCVFVTSLVAARGRLYMLLWVLAVVIGIYSFLG